MRSIHNREQTIYKGKNLYSIAMPLGGIGTGSIALCGDGSLRQWQIHNQVNHLAHIPDSFFAVQINDAQKTKKPIAKVLQSDENYYQSDFPHPPPTSNDHVIPDACKSLMEYLPSIEKLNFIGNYPIAEINYLDDEVPVEIKLHAFSPFIPLDSKNSGLPVIFFIFTIHNQTKYSQDGSIMATLQNAVGWDGIVEINKNKSSLYGGNTNQYIKVEDFNAIEMRSEQYHEDDPLFGQMALATNSEEIFYSESWDDMSLLWRDFSRDGRIQSRIENCPSELGKTWNSAISVPFIVEPGETKTIKFFYTWYFPNRTVNWSQSLIGYKEKENESAKWIGNYYCRDFSSVSDVLSYVNKNLDYLTERTITTCNFLSETTLPDSIIEISTSQLSIIRSPIFFRTYDGYFWCFEGGFGASTGKHDVGGCCPLNCTHVLNYEYALSRFFPDLERKMREIDWDFQQHKTGFILHRTLLPLKLPRIWKDGIEGPDKPALDGLFGTVLKTYREFRVIGDQRWLLKYWGKIKKTFEFIWSHLDIEEQGVVAGEQPNTYDISIFGLNTFIGSLYLAALKAASKMAVVFYDQEFHEKCERIARDGRETLEKELWNGNYFIQKVDLNTYPDFNWVNGCHSDQLLGQWWANNLDLGYLFEKNKIRKTLHSLVKNNYKVNMKTINQQRQFVNSDDPGLLNCTWPDNDRPKTKVTPYSDEVWTGIEYEVAGLLLFENEIEMAMNILDSVVKRHDGCKENPWNNIECGDHYVRALSSWAMVEIAAGYTFDGSTNEVKIFPRINPENFCAPLIFNNGWGVIKQNFVSLEKNTTIQLLHGFLDLKNLWLLSPKDMKIQANIFLDGKKVAFNIKDFGEKVHFEFSQKIKINEGSTLKIIFF